MIDILLAVYNGEQYLEMQLDSILKQSFKDWHLIVGDDCSTDESKRIVERYVKKFPGKISLCYNSKNSGSPVENFSRLLRQVKADYVAFCDHDDVWKVDRLELCLKHIKMLEDSFGNIPILVHTDLEVVDRNLNVISNSFINYQNLDSSAVSLQKLIVQNNITGCSMLINRQLVERCKNIPKGALMHDWWLGLVAAAFGKIGFLNCATVLYRQHGSNSVGAKKVFSLKYLVNKLFDRNAIKKSIESTYFQVRLFLEKYEASLSHEQCNILNSYLKIENSNKLIKVKKLIFGNFLKYGVLRKIAQIIFV